MRRRSKLQFPTVLLIFLLGVLMSHTSDAGKVLLVPPPVFDSHWFAQAKIGQALADREHVVTAVVSKDIVDKRRLEMPKLQFETFDDKGTRKQVQKIVDQTIATAEALSIYQMIVPVFSASGARTQHCDLLLGDRKLIGRLKAEQYHVVISDPVFPCGAILAAHLGANVRLIFLMREDISFFDIDATGVPMPLSYVTSNKLDLTDQMTFPQRLQNVVFYSVVPMARRWVVSNTYGGLVRKYVSAEETMKSVTSRTDLYLYRQDHVLDFPRPSMPNTVLIGGMIVRDAIPLTEDLEVFMQSAGDGVIVASFGTIARTMSPEKGEIFAAAFARLRQKVVWRYEGEKPAGLGSNTKLMARLPQQNDLLGHPKTRAFITQAGGSAIYEALHHGVPMVCLPLAADHPGNAARVVARGLGVKLDFNTVTTDKLYGAILHVLTNNSYQETATRLSRLHRDQPQSPMERAVWWIEHVIRHGGLPHLRARAVELPFYQYHLLDVAAFLLAVCSAVLGAVWCSCSLMCRKCCSKSNGKTKSE